MTDTNKPEGLPQLDGVGITPYPDAEPAAPTPLAEEPLAPTLTTPVPDRDVQRLFIRAYSLVASALLLSAVVASQVSIPDDENIFQRPLAVQILFLLEVACVAVLSRYAARFSRNFAAMLLFFWAAVNGISFTFFFHWLPPSAIAYGFLMCSLSFGVATAIAHRAGIDLSSWKGYFLLIGVGFALIVSASYSLRLTSDFWATAIVGFAIFGFLAAFFGDDIRDLDLEFEDDLSGWKSAVCGALILYLNFANVYLILMRLRGRSVLRDDSDPPRRPLF